MEELVKEYIKLAWKRRKNENFTEEEENRWSELKREIESAMRKTPPILSKDLREFVRIPLICNISFETSNRFYEGLILNINEKGCFIQCRGSINVGDYINEIKLPLGNLPPIILNAKVIWQEKIKTGIYKNWNGYGVKFVDLSEKDKEELYKAIDTLLLDKLCKKS